MSAVAGVPRAPAPPQARTLSLRIPPIALRLATFAALAGYCLAHYALLVEPTAGGRAAALVAVTTLGGAALAATATLPRLAGIPARLLLVVLIAVAALAATGLRAKLLLPGNWDALGRGLEVGFAGLDSFSWPYDGDEPWVRRTILLAMPVLAVPAALLAFWPARRSGAVAALRTLALVPLLMAYGTGVTDLELGSWALRGGVLLLLIAAFLWLPRLRGRDALAAFAAVAACGFAAVPLADGLDARQPWVDYRTWDWFTQPVTGTTFGWDHVYGPINWSREGVTLLEIQSPEAHYWKAETLDRFDGLRWLHAESAFKTQQSQQDIPQRIPAEWGEVITVEVKELTSKVVVGAGTIYRTEGDRATADEPDGTVRVLDEPLGKGDTYKVYAYVPDPSAERMRRAPKGYPERLAEYTYYDLPAPGESGLDRPDLSAAARARGVTSRTVQPGIATDRIGESDDRVLASPYARMWRLSQQLAAGQPTDYDVVKRVERYLQRGFEYSENPPPRKHPLPAFLFEDKIGYCQQFSGAMALMLRMNGIPARVATGFSPGAFNHRKKRYVVRDFDAHSWVEVWFSGIGWVPFDPTPSQAPASSQSSSSTAASAARGSRADAGGNGAAARSEVASGGGATAQEPEETSTIWPLLVAAGVLGAGGLAVLWLAGILRARTRFAATSDGAVQELRAALERLGHLYPERTTLAELERRLRVTSGEPAASYVARLRALRYAPPGLATPPGQRERRDLRRALTAGGGPLARLRGLVVLPPHPRRRAF